MQFNGVKHLKIRCTVVEKKFTKVNIIMYLFDEKMWKIAKILKLALSNLKYTKKWRKMYAI